jgi:hypothetical protein
MQKLVHISFPLLLSFLAFIAAFYIWELSLRVYKELAVQAISVGQNLLQSIGLLFLWVFFTRLSAIVLFEYILRRYYDIAIPKFLAVIHHP